MVISGGNFKPDTLKPKEVVSLLLDDEELEKKCKYSKPLTKALSSLQKMFLWPHPSKNGRTPWHIAKDCIWGEPFFMLITYIKTQTSMCDRVEDRLSYILKVL